MYHALKLFLKIIQQRTYTKIEQNISSSQFGFRNGLGTRKALFCLQILIQRSRDLNKNSYICFIDFEKAFDKIHHAKLIEVLEKIGLDDKDIIIIKKTCTGNKQQLFESKENLQSLSILNGASDKVAS